MSRIGKKPILIPSGVEAKTEGNVIKIKGPKGELQRTFLPDVNVEIANGSIQISPKIQSKNAAAFWGLTRALIFNMVKGVTDGFEKKLDIQGIGYKASVEGEKVVLYVGFSHAVKIEIPKEIKVSVEKSIITVSGADKEVVGQLAANIRKAKPMEPYKGKGLKYVNEIVRRKVGKKVAGTTTAK
jgi:large subunit ribosomal protein L6